MIKVDLHIHTSPSVYEPKFDFSMDKLKEYVIKMELDAIALTNHNHFYREQFELITRELNCFVFPGVEVDIESSHLLVIVALDRLEELTVACSQLATMIKSEKDYITFEQFITIFPNYRDYILIPHIKKDPIMKFTTLDKFGGFIKTGEVRSPKNFELMKKEEDSLVPVLFSDTRLEENEDGFPSRCTYIDINNIEFNILKTALVDKK